jgi:SurA N-terminal domain
MDRRRPSRTRYGALRGLSVRVAAAAIALAGTVAVTACEPGRLGAAAVVGDSRLTVAQVQQQVQDYADSLGSPVALPRLDVSSFQRKVVQDFVRHELTRRVAASRSIEVSPAQIDAQLQGLRQQGEQAFDSTLAQQGYTSQTVRDFVYDSLVAQRLGSAQQAEAALTAAASAADTWVSPRYGTLEGLTLTGTSGSLSVPASPTPTASPTP